MTIIPLNFCTNNTTKQSNFHKYSYKSYKFASIYNFLSRVFLFLLLINASQQTGFEENDSSLRPDLIDDFGPYICKKCLTSFCREKCSGVPKNLELDWSDVKGYFDNLVSSGSSPAQPAADTNVELLLDFDLSLFDDSIAGPSGIKRRRPFDSEVGAFPSKKFQVTQNNSIENETQYFKVKDCVLFLESKGVEVDDKLLFEISDIYGFVESKVKELIKEDLFPFIDLKLLYEQKVKEWTKIRDNRIKHLSKKEIKEFNEQIEKYEKDFNECKQVEYNAKNRTEKLLDPEVSSHFLHSIFYELYLNKNTLLEEEAAKNKFINMVKDLIATLIVFARLNMLWTNHRINNLIKNKFFEDDFKRKEVFRQTLNNDYYKEPLKIIDFAQIDYVELHNLFNAKSIEYYNRIIFLKENIFKILKKSEESKIDDNNILYSINPRFETEIITEISEILIRKELFVLNDIYSYFIEKDLEDCDKITQPSICINNIVNLLLSKSENKIYMIEYFFHLAEIKMLHYKSELNNEYSLEAVDKLGKSLNYFFMTFIIRDILAKNKFATKKYMLFELDKLRNLLAKYKVFADKFDKNNCWEKLQTVLESRYKTN